MYNLVYILCPFKPFVQEVIFIIIISLYVTRSCFFHHYLYMSQVEEGGDTSLDILREKRQGKSGMILVVAILVVSPSMSSSTLLKVSLRRV